MTSVAVIEQVGMASVIITEQAEIMSMAVTGDSGGTGNSGMASMTK